MTLQGTAEVIEDSQTAQADIQRLARRSHPSAKAEQMIRDYVSKQRVTICMTIQRVHHRTEPT